MAFIGDRHAQQLSPLAEKIGRSDGLSVYNVQDWGCLVPQLEQKPERAGCAKVNRVPDRLADLLDRPVIVVVASIADPVLHFPSRRCRTQDPPPVQGSLEQDRGTALGQRKRPAATSSSAPHQSNRQAPALAPESHQATTHQLA